MALPPGDRRVSGRAKTRQPTARRRHAPTPLYHGEEALYPPDWSSGCPVCARVPLLLVQHCLIFRPHCEPLFCCTPALPLDARVGRAQLPVLLSRRAQWLRCIPCEAIRPGCCAYPGRSLPCRLSRSEAAGHAPRGRVWSWSSPWLPPLSPLQYVPKWSPFCDRVSCCRFVDGSMVRPRVMDVEIQRFLPFQTTDMVIPCPPHSGALHAFFLFT